MAAFLAILVLVLAGQAAAQLCEQDAAVLSLTNAGSCSGFTPVTDCLAQSGLLIASDCRSVLRPGIPLSGDGTNCNLNQGILQRGLRTLSGRYRLGMKPMTWTMAAGGPQMLLMRLTGTYASPAGGQEYDVDCTMQFRVVNGQAMGMVAGTTEAKTPFNTLPTLGLPAGYSAEAAAPAKAKNSAAGAAFSPSLLLAAGTLAPLLLAFLG